MWELVIPLVLGPDRPAPNDVPRREVRYEFATREQCEARREELAVAFFYMNNPLYGPPIETYDQPPGVGVRWRYVDQYNIGICLRSEEPARPSIG